MVYDKVIDKDDNTTQVKEDNNVLEEKYKVGDFGNINTEISLDYMKVKINSNNSLNISMIRNSSEETESNENISIDTAIIPEKIVSIEKTYTCDAYTFWLAVITETGNIYVADIEEFSKLSNINNGDGNENTQTSEVK